MTNDHGGVWNRSELGRERVKDSPYYTEAEDSRRGAWHDREIITRDTSINRGVYLGGNEREAIVVDDTREESREIYERVFQSVQEAVTQHEQKGEQKKSVLLPVVYDITRREIPYDEFGTEELLKKLFGSNLEDQKIDLTYFIEHHTGVCRQQVLLAGYLIERLIANGDLRGRVSIDRNSIPNMGAHTWVRYTSHSGKVFILDATRGYLGSLEDSAKKGTWIYSRPDDPVLPYR